VALSLLISFVWLVLLYLRSVNFLLNILSYFCVFHFHAFWHLFAQFALRSAVWFATWTMLFGVNIYRFGSYLCPIYLFPLHSLQYLHSLFLVPSPNAMCKCGASLCTCPELRMVSGLAIFPSTFSSTHFRLVHGSPLHADGPPCMMQPCIVCPHFKHSSSGKWLLVCGFVL